MKDKEKQIEEMAKADKDLIQLCKLLFENWDGTVINAAKTVLEHYQPKIPEDSVVLSREEWEDYKKYVDNCIEEYYRGQHEAEVYYKNIQIPRERKETAEKIAKYLFSICVLADIPHCMERYFKEQFGVEIKE